MDNQVMVSDYATMDHVIKKAGCNVLLIQKSILRDGLSFLAVHLFDKMKRMVVKLIEREDVDFMCETIGCRPIAYRLSPSTSLLRTWRATTWWRRSRPATFTFSSA